MTANFVREGRLRISSGGPAWPVSGAYESTPTLRPVVHLVQMLRVLKGVWATPVESAAEPAQTQCVEPLRALE